MKRKLLRILCLAACLGVVAFSMTGCLGTWALGHTIGGKVAGEVGRAAGELGGEIGRAAGELGGEIGHAAGSWGHEFGDRFDHYSDSWERHFDDWEDYCDDWEDYPDHWNDWSGAVGEGILNNLPTPREYLLENVAEENRQLQTISDEGISRISISITSPRTPVTHNDTVIIEKGGEDGQIGVEYDDAHFTVKRNALNGVAEISVRGTPRTVASRKRYQVRIKLPARLFEQIRVRGEDMAVTLLDLDSPLDVVISDSALSMEGCTGPAELDVDDSAVSVFMPGSYADSFRLKGENCAVTLAFQDKKPDNLSLGIEADNSAVAISLDGVESYQSNYSLKEGDGSTKVTLDLENTAATVGIRTVK